ncbi:Dual specificity mitogen-activated protein kinase kinase 1 [Taenia solium]|eukprot:TsM_000859800 transcript=TsM_000859800 gene=TsM_000859800
MPCVIFSQRQLDDQQLDDSQRERIEEFLRCKKDIHELHPEDFTKISELGSGNWGVVSRVRYNRTNIIMAKKTIRLDIKHEVGTQILRELEILHDCASPYIIGFYGAFLADGNINICMEYMDGGSLDMVLKHAGRMPEPIVSRILYAVLCGLEYLRKQLSMIHRDVKPSNILMRRNGEIKLCDFGASGKLIDSVAHSFVGSRSYMAPERISGQSYNTSSDVWSLGLTLIELATGRYPIPAIENEAQYYTGFSNDRQTNLKEHIAAAREGRKLPPVTTPEQAPLSIFELLVLIVEQPLPRLPRTCFSDDFIDLVASCLRTESVERPSLEVLQHHAFVTTVAGLVPAGANRRSSIRFRDLSTTATASNASGASQDTNIDLNMDDIAFYLSHILPPHDGIG